MSSMVLPRPTVAGMGRPMTQARQRCLLVAYMAAVVCLAVVSTALAIFCFKGMLERGGQQSRKDSSSIEMVKRQFQGGGVIGDIPADPTVSNIISDTPGLPDVSVLSGSGSPIDSQASNIDGIVDGVSETVGSILGGAIPTPGQDMNVAPAATPGLPDLGQLSTPADLVQSSVESLLNGGLTPPLPVPTPPESPTVGLSQFSVTLPPVSPVSTPLTGGLDTDEVADQFSSVTDDAALPLSPSLPESPLRSGQLSISLPATPTVPTDTSASAQASPDAIPEQSVSDSAGLGEILSNDATTDVDSAALLSGLSNIVDQISGVDPEAAGDLTDAVVGALPDDIPGAAGVLPGAQDAIDSGSSERLDSVIPSVAGAIGEDVVPIDPIDPNDASGALGNVVNRGKTIVNQITEAMGDNIDPALQEVVDNVSNIVNSAEQQLEEPLCLASEVVNGATDQVMLPCAEAEPGAPTTIAHLAPTQASSPAQSQGTGQPSDSDTSSEQPQSDSGSSEAPSEGTPDTQEDPSPSQGSSGNDPSIPQSPDQSHGAEPQPGQDDLQEQPAPQDQSVPPEQGVPQDSSGEDGSDSNSDVQVPGQGSNNGDGGQSPASSSAEASIPGAQPTSQSTSQSTAPVSPNSSEGSSGGPGSSQEQPGSLSQPSDQSSPGAGSPIQQPGTREGETAPGSSGSGSSAPDPGSSPATPTTPHSPSNGLGSPAIDSGCPICPQCMPQSCDGDYDFDSDQSPCDGRGFECDDCLHGWFCPPRETPAQAAPCGLGWPCYHCSDGWFCVPDEDNSPDFVISSNGNGGVENQPPEYDDSSAIKSQRSTRSESDDGVNDFYYLGCFQDGTSQTLLGGVSVDYLSGRMSTSICVNHCLERGYTFAGTENGHECWCGETIRPDAKKLPESSCQTSCHGNQSNVCGGNMAISIFADKDEYQEAAAISRR